MERFPNSDRQQEVRRGRCIHDPFYNSNEYGDFLFIISEHFMKSFQHSFFFLSFNRGLVCLNLKYFGEFLAFGRMKHSRVQGSHSCYGMPSWECPFLCFWRRYFASVALLSPPLLCAVSQWTHFMTFEKYLWLRERYAIFVPMLMGLSHIAHSYNKRLSGFIIWQDLEFILN